MGKFNSFQPHTFYHYTSNSKITDNLWHSIATSINRLTSQKIYFDWVLESSTDISSISSQNEDNTVNMVIWKSISWYLSWSIDEIRIYNRSLSDSEIQNLYNATK